MRRTARQLLGLVALVTLAGCDSQRTTSSAPSTIDASPPSRTVLTAIRASHERPAWYKGSTPQHGGTRLSVTAASSAFQGFFRYPVEEQQWMALAGDSAYYRDQFVSGDTYIDEAADGDSWYAKAMGPNGTQVTWQSITFHSTYNGEQDCFVTISWYLCGGKSIYIQWYMTSQCQPTGQWTMQFFANGAQFHEGMFNVVPTIPDDKITLISQGAYPTVQYSNTCTLTTNGANRHRCDGRANEQIFTIQQLGCALTSAAMMLSYHGVAVDPATLNTWLRANGGYSGTAIDFHHVQTYGRLVGGRDITMINDVRGVATAADNTALQHEVCQYGPQPINVYGTNGLANGHWVLATGRDHPLTTFRVGDPNGGVFRTLQFARYRNTNYGRRVFSGPEFTYTDPNSGMEFFFHSPGELLVTNGSGQRTGYDPLSNTIYNEIPGAVYDSTSDSDPTDESFVSHTTREFSFLRPPAGDYTVSVTGTGSGTYMLDLRTWTSAGNEGTREFDDIPIAAGVTHSYRIAYDPASTSGGTIPLTGGFSGGGQSGNVDAFLTYSAPTEHQVGVPAGTTSYPLMIFYGKTIDPSTFMATLNGTDVTSLFTPTPGGMNPVSLPLTSGRNVLLVSVRGSNGARMPRDADRLVFKVP